MQNNPLLQTQQLPAFDKIHPDHVEPALDLVLADNRQEIQQLCETVNTPSWDNFIHPLNELNDRLNVAWSPVSHLHSVADSDDLRAAYNNCLPKLSQYSSEIGQNRTIFDAYHSIANSAEFKNLSPAQQRTIENELQDFHLSGIDLEPEQQARYREIQQQLSKLSSEFSQHLLDATHEWKKHLQDEKQLSGLPDSLVSLLKQNAEHEGLDGWLITLDAPCYVPFMNYADDRELRHELYEAFATRASDVGPSAGQFDNSELMKKILDLRYELAKLLGFETYAGYSLYKKMAEMPEQVLEFLTDLAGRAKPVAQKEYAELCDFAREHYGVEQLEMWDVPYYSEKLRQHQYALSQEDLRPYFPLPQVINGLFTIVQRLYGIEITQAEAAVWHSDVQFYQIHDENGELRAQFYLDLYARKGKRGGAWMGTCQSRKRRDDGSVQLPVAYMNCNFTPTVGDTPVLLTHNEVTTLFHEFGHGLHHMLTQVDYAPVAGISGVPWDAVELPSQFMENWCWEREALDLFARHYKTGDAIPDDLFEKMQAAKNFQAGLFLVRQLEFAIFDFRLHHEYQPGLSVQNLLDSVREEVAVLIPPEYNRFQHSFQHIFAGGYAAGYYSYKWAEVLSADAFSLFEERGIFDQTTGRQFLHAILEQGGSQEPMKLFVDFRGREPEIDALLRHTGIAA